MKNLMIREVLFTGNDNGGAGGQDVHGIHGWDEVSVFFPNRSVVFLEVAFIADAGELEEGPQ